MELSELKAFTASVIAPILEECEHDEEERQKDFPDVWKNETAIIAVPEEKEEFPISGKTENAIPTIDEFLQSINFRMSGKLPELERRAESWRKEFEGDFSRFGKDAFHYGERYDYTRLEIALYYSLQDLKSNFIRIGQILYMLRESPNPFCTNMEYSAARFGLSKTTAYNLVGIYERFATPDGQLKPQYEKMSFSHLSEWLSFSDEEIEKYKRTCTTVAEIRALKKSLRSSVIIEVTPTSLKSEALESDIETKEIEKIETVTNTKEIKPHEPQGTSGTVYFHFDSEIEFTRWYYDNFDKLEIYPLTVCYFEKAISEEN